MASISTSIDLHDNLSMPVLNMIHSLSNLTKGCETVNNAMSSAFSDTNIQEANAACMKMTKTIDGMDDHIRNNNDSQQQFNNSLNQGVNNSNNLMRSIKGIVAAYVSIQTVRKATNISDELAMTTARLDLMNSEFNKINGSAMETSELVNLVYQSAQNARGSFGDMAAIVAKFGNNARDAFSSQAEVVEFANLIQKQMTIAGASTMESANAMLQLSQALGSGVLRGDELNSIFEQAPNLIQSIADYMDVPIGQIRAMAMEGQITADIVKAAIFEASDEINAKFNLMPMTWNQVWTMMSNTAVMQMQPVLDKINQLANNPEFQEMMIGVLNSLAVMAVMLLDVMEFAGQVAAFFRDNWSIIEPLIMGIVFALGAYLVVSAAVNTMNAILAVTEGVKAAAQMMATGATFAQTAAQHGLNAALLACPITWIILAIIALIAVIYAVCAAIAKMTGIANTGFGIIAGGVMVVIMFFKNLGLTVANIALGIGQAIAALAGNMMTAFNNAICSVQSWFYNLLATALTVIEGIAAALNKLPFVEFDYSGISAAADDYAAKASAAAGNKQEYQSISEAFSSGFNTFDTFQDGWVKDAFDMGASWGDGVMDGLSNMLSFDSGIDTSSIFDGGGYSPGDYNAGQIPTNIADTAGNTARAADTLEITDEELKYLRDIAERDVINRFTTAEIRVELGGVTNHVASNTDLDGLVDYLATSVQEAMEVAAEGVHV